MKKIVTSIAMILMLSLLLTACGGNASPEATNDQKKAAPVNISISTGGTTGMYYTTHAPICDLINAKSTKIRVVPATSGGSTENLNNVLNGVSEIGCVYNNEVMSGYEKNNKLRFIGPTTQVSPLQLVVKSNSGIKSLDDLKGKNIHLGAAGSGARAWTVLFFEWAGLKDKINEVPLGNEEAVTALGDDDVAMITVAGLAPSARVTEAAVSNDIELLDLSEYLEAFFKEYPYFEEYVIPAGTYKGVDYEVSTFGLATSLVCMEDMDSEVLTEYMTLAYSEEAQKAALSSNPVGPDHNPKDPLANAKIPLHPAAAKFWESKGFTVSK